MFTQQTHLHDKLVCTADQFELVGVVERLRNILAERVSRATRRYAPASSIVRVRPQQVAHWTLVRNFLDSVQRSHVIQRVDGRREPTVQTEYLQSEEKKTNFHKSGTCRISHTVQVINYKFITYTYLFFEYQ